MEQLIISSIKFIHILVSILLIIVVLLQPGKSGDLGSVFGGGGGSSESVFGASGAVPFLSKVTRVLAVLFLLSSLALGYYAASGVNSSVITDLPPAQQTEITPAIDISDPVENQELPEGSNQGAAPAGVTQESGEQAPVEANDQISNEQPDTSGNEQPTQDNSEATQ